MCVGGSLYRSASLYHPQRRAILHLKNQKRKIKSKRDARTATSRPPLFELTSLRSRSFRMFCLSRLQSTKLSIGTGAMYTYLFLIRLGSTMFCLVIETADLSCGSFVLIKNKHPFSLLLPLLCDFKKISQYVQVQCTYMYALVWDQRYVFG